MSRRISDLTTCEWQLGQAPRRPFGAAPVDDRADVREWLPASVPGDVRADLIAAGRIPPVETPEGIAAGAWVDDYDWWYRVVLSDLKQFGNARHTEHAEAVAKAPQVVLEADGIDYRCAIWLDDRLLATHEGMFGRQTVFLPPGCCDSGMHELAVRVWGAGALPALPNPLSLRVVRRLLALLSPGFEYFPDRMAVPKAQFGFGWDFAPRLLSTGIWDGLRLVAAGVYIEGLGVRPEPLSEDDPTPVRWRLRLRVHARQAQRLLVETTIEPEEPSREPSGCACSAPVSHRHVTTFDLRAAGPADLDVEVITPEVRRWWPWDQGEPCLYRVTVRLSDDTGALDEISRITGVRTVARTALPDGRPWRFVINGRPLFLRGANWAPADVLPGRVGPEDYDRLLGQARAAGINFLRVWGGGVREKAAFWELCDRLGVMAWQEFPLACAFLDHYPRDPDYLDILASEARGIVRELRDHPSLIAWSGGNEINPARERIPLGVIAGVLREEDPERPWIPASPSDGEVHQWRIWHGYAPWTELARTETPFLSEFGLQALPDKETIGAMFAGPLPESLDDVRWGSRKAQVDKLYHYAGPQSRGSGLAAIVAGSQRVQAAGLQAGIEGRRLARETTGGVAFWQFNEPWPAVSWSVIDRFGRPKAAYQMLCRSYQPVLIALRFQNRACLPGEMGHAEVWLVNDGPSAWSDCRADAHLRDAQLWSAEGLALPAGGVVCAGSLTWRATPSQGVVRLRLFCGQAELATNLYDLDVPIAGPGPRSARWRQALASYLLRAD